MVMLEPAALERCLVWVAAAGDVNVHLHLRLEFAESWSVANHVSRFVQRWALVVEEAEVSDLQLVADGQPRAAPWQRHPVAD